MRVEFFEKEITGKAVTATKLCITKTVGPEYVITRTATEQDKAEFKMELERFIGGKEVLKEKKKETKPKKKAKKEEVKEEVKETEIED